VLKNKILITSIKVFDTLPAEGVERKNMLANFKKYPEDNPNGVLKNAARLLVFTDELEVSGQPMSIT
jgi:hypothetical protein